ncbi:MAG TPA: M50 family metallopeptidase, partial [Candidatus Thermoplasmatota archaeon]|nr:M50 family metallopeptidase [Candidatus Thermoplasmatota archaeon]
MTSAPARPEEPRARTALGVGSVRGIPIRLHWTLLLALPFFAWLMATAYFGTDPAGWAWGAALAVALFASVTVHELAHSLVALRRGVRIREILLMPIGGVSVMETPAREPRAELAITIAGPLSSLLLGAAALVAALALGVPIGLPRDVPRAPAFLLLVGYLNLT